MNIRQEQYKKVPFHTKMNLKNVRMPRLEVDFKFSIQLGK